MTQEDMLALKMYVDICNRKQDVPFFVFTNVKSAEDYSIEFIKAPLDNNNKPSIEMVLLCNEELVNTYKYAELVDMCEISEKEVAFLKKYKRDDIVGIAEDSGKYYVYFGHDYENDYAYAKVYTFQKCNIDGRNAVKLRYDKSYYNLFRKYDNDYSVREVYTKTIYLS